MSTLIYTCAFGEKYRRMARALKESIRECGWFDDFLVLTDQKSIEPSLNSGAWWKVVNPSNYFAPAYPGAKLMRYALHRTGVPVGNWDRLVYVDADCLAEGTDHRPLSACGGNRFAPELHAVGDPTYGSWTATAMSPELLERAKDKLGVNSGVFSVMSKDYARMGDGVIECFRTSRSAIRDQPALNAFLYGENAFSWGFLESTAVRRVNEQHPAYLVHYAGRIDLYRMRVRTRFPGLLEGE